MRVKRVLTSLADRGVASVVAIYNQGRVTVRLLDDEGDGIGFTDQTAVLDVENVVRRLLSEVIGAGTADADGCGTVHLWPETGEYSIDHGLNEADAESVEGYLWADPAGNARTNGSDPGGMAPVKKCRSSDSTATAPRVSIQPSRTEPQSDKPTG